MKVAVIQSAVVACDEMFSIMSASFICALLYCEVSSQLVMELFL